MKLIIDISEEDYKERTNYLRGFNEKALKEPFMNATLENRLDIALLHGTPLDDIKEEIAEEICLTDNPYTKETKYTIEHLKLLKILDGIGRAESGSEYE